MRSQAPGHLTPGPVPGPFCSRWTLIVRLITASPGLRSVCVGTLCKHFLLGRAGNEGMTRSSDFPRLLPSCPSSQAPPRPSRAFAGLLSWALGGGGGGGQAADREGLGHCLLHLGRGALGSTPVLPLPGWVLWGKLLNLSELPFPHLPRPFPVELYEMTRREQSVWHRP